ncbi:MAG: BON domain-containing protein [Pirellulales bacterium]|nr:BON domain-containing protein [Pirellulales bacterium]
MVELVQKDRLIDKPADVASGISAEFGQGRDRRPTPSADALQVVRTDAHGAHGARTALVLSIRARLERHPHFRGRSSQYHVELVEDTIVLSGCFPSHHLKQLLQEAVRVMPGVLDIDNQVSVARPNEG